METWKDIPGFEGRYQASTAGRIRSVDRRVTQTNRWGTQTDRLLKGRVLRPGQFCKAGHVSVTLGHGANGTPVHHLVLLTFAGPPGAGQEVRHLNGDPKDNRLENLAYGTRTENILDVFRQGKAWRKLTAKDAADIRIRLRDGDTGAAIARDYGVSQSAISQIKRRRTHWHE